MNAAVKVVGRLGLAMVLLGVGGTAGAAMFVNPPELTHPGWVEPMPYQRNILVGFDTDPHFWPDHISSPVPDARKALTPLVVHHEGRDDERLYPSDWLGGEAVGGDTGWLDQDTQTGTDRQGILTFTGGAESTFSLTWHIDNWDRPHEEKHFFVEAEYYSTGNVGLDELISSTGQVETLDPHYETLPGGWVRWHSWATLQPNPVYEEMVNTVTFTEPGSLLIDYMHIATECVPEPCAIAFLGMGILGVAVRRRGTR